jgi:amino acid permease
MKSRMKAWTSTSNDKDESLPETAWTSENTDVEKITTAPLQRRLQPRHLQMLAIGGTVGTGLVCKILTAGHPTHMYMLSVLIAIVELCNRVQRSIAND